jgi:fatty-acyl-CoA synthase
MRTDVAPGLRVVDLLWHDARLYPQRVALRIDGVERSFEQLAARVQALAAHWSASVRPGQRIGLWFHNCHAWVESFLALNALGAVAVPINTRLTAAELRQIFGLARLHGLVTTRHYRRRNYLEEARQALRDAGVFCIQYTSGTTSLPKGVMLTDAAYLATAAYVARCQRLTPSSRFISAGPFFHCSGSMHALTVCLLAGCTLTSMSVWDPQEFLDRVERERCDVSHMVYFRDVLALGSPRARAQLASMQVTHDLGTPEFLQRIHDELGIAGISNLYGMTETAGQFTMWFPDDALALRVRGNGRPQPGNEIRIADPLSLSPVAAGGTGEIQMRGSTLSPGYFANPKAQAEAFTPDGWFRSGDLGRLGDQGELVYVARLKEIIRVGGENLAPAEVEEALREICGSSLVCVLGLPDERLDEVPVAVLARPQVQDWPQALAQLRQRLAGFKMPRAVYVADDLPSTATNRVQRAVLRTWIEQDRLERVV